MVIQSVNKESGSGHRETRWKYTLTNNPVDRNQILLEYDFEETLFIGKTGVTNKNEVYSIEVDELIELIKKHGKKLK